MFVCCLCDQKTLVYTLTGQTSLRKRCVLLTHPLYMSPCRDVRSTSRTENANPLITIHIIVPGSLGNLLKRYDKNLASFRDCHAHLEMQESQPQRDGSALKLLY